MNKLGKTEKLFNNQKKLRRPDNRKQPGSDVSKTAALDVSLLYPPFNQ